MKPPSHPENPFWKRGASPRHAGWPPAHLAAAFLARRLGRALTPWFRAVLILGLPLALTASLPGVRGADMVLVNAIAALVGDSVITREQVERFTARARQTYAMQYANQPELRAQRITEALAQGLNGLIERRLILQEFQDLKVNIPESIIEGRVEEEIKQRFGEDRAVLTRTLQQEGSTLEDFRREIREQIIEAAMRFRNVPRDILVSPGRIERYYREHEDTFRVQDQVKLSMIVLDKARTSADVGRLGREILAKIAEGADFAEMAAVYSDSRARESGAWGWVDRKVLREDLADLAFAMPAGTRSEVIDKPEAAYIMFVEEVRNAHVRPLADVRGSIERTLVEEERKRLEKQWLDRLRAKSFIRYFWVIPTSRPSSAP